jgi:hypothetical protein
MERRPHPGRQLIYVSTGVVLDIGGQLSRLPELPVGLTSEPRPRAVVEAQALATGADSAACAFVPRHADLAQSAGGRSTSEQPDMRA